MPWRRASFCSLCSQLPNTAHGLRLFGAIFLEATTLQGRGGFRLEERLLFTQELLHSGNAANERRRSRSDIVVDRGRGRVLLMARLLPYRRDRVRMSSRATVG